MPKVLLRTLGCRLNQAETAEIEEGLISSGFELAGADDVPDVVVVNTCTVTADSSRSSRRLIARSVRQFPRARVLVTGCYAVAAPSEVAAMEGVDEVVANKDKDSLVDYLRERYFPTTLNACSDNRSCGGYPHPGNCLPRLDSPRVTLKVQTGCDEMCTFCIVPTTRGDLDSRPAEEVIYRARSAVERGAREITLSGVHLGKYGRDRDEGSGLYDLVWLLLDELPEEVRLRLSSVEVTCVRPELVELMATEERLCRHLHIPLQSGDDTVLQAMKRPYTAKKFLEMAASVKERVPGVAITTDVLVGFPGETVRAFENTIRVVEEVGFAKLHVFRYSARDGTPAASMEGQVSEEEKKARSRVIRELGDELRLEFHRREAGRGLLEGVLVEGAGPADSEESISAKGARPRLFGITDNYVKVETAGPAGLVGEVVAVSPSGVSVDKVRGELASGIPDGGDEGREAMPGERVLRAEREPVAGPVGGASR